MNHISEVKACPDCASQNIVVNDIKEQIICRDCGLIFEPFLAVKKTKKKPKSVRKAKTKKKKPKSKKRSKKKPKKKKTAKKGKKKKRR